MWPPSSPRAIILSSKLFRTNYLQNYHQKSYALHSSFSRLTGGLVFHEKWLSLFLIAKLYSTEDRNVGENYNGKQKRIFPVMMQKTIEFFLNNE